MLSKGYYFMASRGSYADKLYCKKVHFNIRNKPNFVSLCVFLLKDGILKDSYQTGIIIHFYF
jgi:hypothetical protein